MTAMKAKLALLSRVELNVNEATKAFTDRLVSELSRVHAVSEKKPK
jgi:hypothetical protein